jgi:hypothetical protein
MGKRDKVEYQAKVTDDGGLTRGRVPCPLLSAIGARPGDYLTFRLADTNKVVMHLSRLRRKSAKGKGKRR